MRVLLLLSCHDQFRLFNLSLEPVALGLRLWENIAYGRAACFEFFNQFAVFRDLLPMPFDFGLIRQGGITFMAAL